MGKAVYPRGIRVLALKFLTRHTAEKPDWEQGVWKAQVRSHHKWRQREKQQHWGVRAVLGWVEHPAGLGTLW